MSTRHNGKVVWPEGRTRFFWECECGWHGQGRWLTEECEADGRSHRKVQRLLDAKDGT